MKRTLSTTLGKAVRQISRIKGSGQALPGLIVEKLFPTYFADMISQLPEGVVVITGTNGKTTTTKMVVELLQAQGKKVITNPTGSNLTRGIVSSLIEQADSKGRLPFDMAVFEIDEAYARQFVKQVKPRWVLALNVSRDQLDRFGEVDTVAQLIGITMRAATEGVVTNANDPRLSAIAKEIQQQGVIAKYFGVAKQLEAFFPSDNALVSIESDDNQTLADASPSRPDVELTAFQNQTASYSVGDKLHQVSLQVTGQHNFQNAAAALALVKALCPDVADDVLVAALGSVGIAFGRGEIFTLKNGSQVQLVLVKNPASFRQSLASYLIDDPLAMIVINDNYADSRDVSWLWDVDFEPLSGQAVRMTSGSRAADMTLRLSYSGISVDQTEPDIDVALKQFCSQDTNRKVILSTYTAMLYMYDILKRKAGTEL